MKSFFSLLKKTVAEFIEDKAARLAAALSYYTIISLAPLVVIALGVAGLFWQNQADLRGQFEAQAVGLLGAEGGQVITNILENASQPEAGGVVATVFSVIVLLFGASGVFSQLQDALDTIWDVEPKPGRGIMATIKDRLLSFGMVLAVGFLLLVSLVLNAALSAAGAFFSNTLPGGELVWQVINFLVSFGVITVLFALIYKIVPDVEVEWRDVWVGALFTSLLFNVGKVGIGLYLGRSTAASAYGAAGSLIIVLLWVYFSALILFLGAEFTQVYSRQRGHGLTPAPNARFISKAARETQGVPSRKEPEGKPELLTKKQPGYTSPLAYPASEAVRVTRRDAAEAAVLPVTGSDPQPPPAVKVLPVVALGALSSGYLLVRSGQAVVSKARAAVRQRSLPTRGLQTRFARWKKQFDRW